MVKYLIATATSFSSQPLSPAHTILSTDLVRDCSPHRCYTLCNFLSVFTIRLFSIKICLIKPVSSPVRILIVFEKYELPQTRLCKNLRYFDISSISM